MNSISFLRQKLCLMTLVEFVFNKTKQQRDAVAFADISKATRVTADEVEHLVMKALSIGLIKGKIDESLLIVKVLSVLILDQLGAATYSF